MLFHFGSVKRHLMHQVKSCRNWIATSSSRLLWSRSREGFRQKLLTPCLHHEEEIIEKWSQKLSKPFLMIRLGGRSQCYKTILYNQYRIEVDKSVEFWGYFDVHRADVINRFWSRVTMLSVRPDWAIYCTLGQLFKACGNNYFAQISHILGNFCKGVKIFNFSSGIIFGNFYRHLATFYWSYCLTTPPSKGRKRFGDDITDKKFDGYRAKELELGQSDQIWQFLKFSVANLLAKLAQIIGDNLVNFKNITF